MRTVVFLILFFSLSTSIFSQNEDIQCVKISCTFPVMGKDLKVKEYQTNSAMLYGYRNIRLYETMYYIQTKEEPPVAHSIYFMYQKDKPYGFDSKHPANLFNDRISVDSFMKKSWFSNENFNQYELFIDNYTTLLSAKRVDNTHTLEEVYEVKEKSDTGSSGKLYLSYVQSMNTLEATLSKQLDSIKNMRLYRVRIVIDPKPGKATGSTTVDFTIEAISVNDPEKYLRYFKMYDELETNKK